MKQSSSSTSNSGIESEIEPLTKKMSNLISVNDSMEEGYGDSCSDSRKMGSQMTIFYDGKVGVYDITELQARAILMLASYQTGQRMRNEELALPLPASFQQRLCSPVNGMSMKGSLRRFLQKRKLRAQARVPY